MPNRIDPEYQRAVSDFVQDAVIMNVFHLVDSIRQDMDSEAVHAISVKDNWLSPALDNGMELTETSEGKFLINIQNENCHLYGVEYDTRSLAAMDYCDLHHLEPYQDEALEFYLVRNWFAKALQEKGELIDLNFFGLSIWGRTCSGQCISLDDVTCEIYEDLNPNMKGISS